MDARGPTISLRTKPTQLDKKRFELEWVLPLEPGLSTHVTLFDLECYPPHAFATGEGGDEADELQDLWTMLTDHHDSVDAVAFVAEAYYRRTGRWPDPTGSIA
jgi:hypothetical protein